MAYERKDYAGAAAETTIAAGINGSDTSISIASSTGWPSGSNGPFVAVIDAGTASEEKVLVTSRTGTTLNSVTRGYDGTSGASHSSGATIAHCIAAKDLDEANYWVAELAGAANAASDIIIADGDNSLSRIAKGSNSTVLQVSSGGTLQYGTITSAMITDGTIATGDIADSAITSAKIADGTIVAGDIASDAVTTAKILDANVTTAKIANLAVTTAKIAAAAVTGTELAASVAGNGLAGGAGSALSVNVDGSTLEINADALRVKDAGITQAKLASGYRAAYAGTAEPAGIAEGDLWAETDANRVHVYDGAASQRIGHWASDGRTGGTWTRATNLSINNATETDITFTTETFDSDGFLTPTSATLTVPSGLGGLYGYDLRFTFSGTAGASGVMVYVNGTQVKNVGLTQGTSVNFGLNGFLALAASDTVKFRVLHNNGAALNLNPASLNFYRLAI